MLDSGRILVKPSVGSGQGMNINFYTGNELGEKEVIDIFNKYKRNYIIQEKLKQHKDIAKIYNGSLNTIRMITFVYKNQARILTTTIRIGSGKSEIDNYSQGGFICKINPDGRLNKYALSKGTGWVSKHPEGMYFKDIVVPNFEKLKEKVSDVQYFRQPGLSHGGFTEEVKEGLYDFLIDKIRENIKKNAK